MKGLGFNRLSGKYSILRSTKRFPGIRMFPLSHRLRHFFLAFIALSFLAACGGNDDDNSTTVRLLNATVGIGTLSLYTGDDKRTADVQADAVSGYVGFDGGTYDAKLKLSGSSSSLLTKSVSLVSGNHYTAVAWGRDDGVKLALLTDDEDDPTSGSAKIRVFNAASDAGSLDMYISDSSASLDGLSANAAGTAAGALSSYAEVGKGTYRLRLTAASEKGDLRLDVASVTLNDQDRVTVVVEPTSGGVLVSALLVVQQKNGITVAKNTNARARVVASVSSNGVASATIGSTTLSSSLTSPGVGSYVVIPAGSQTLLTQMNGATISSATTTIDAGADYTVLIYGNTSLAQMKLISDDNRLPTNTSKGKIRLIPAAEGYDTLSLAVDSVSVANEVPTGTASTFTTVNSNSGNALIEVTSALSSTPLYTTAKSSGSTGVSIDSQGVYTMFMLGGGSTPRGILRKDR